MAAPKNSRVPTSVSEYMSTNARKGGKKRAEVLSSDRRHQIAVKAARARWRKR